MKDLTKKLIATVCAFSMLFACGAVAACQAGNEEGNKPPVTDNGDDGDNGNKENNENKENNDGDNGDNGGDDGNNNENNDNGGNPSEIEYGVAYNASTGAYTQTDVYGNEYILYHNEGDTVEYVFEAECTNLENKSGNTYSGNASGKDMAYYGEGASNDGVVGYLYNYGNSVNFVVISDREVENATLILRCGAQFNDTTVTPTTMTVRVDPVVDEENGVTAADFLTHYQEGGLWGKWDQFLDYFRFTTDMDEIEAGNYNFRGQMLTSFTCGNISIAAQGVMNVTNIDDYTLAVNLHIYEGATSISIITNNNDVPKDTETQRATAVVIDCIKIVTDAQLGLYNPQNNGFDTENACTYTYIAEEE